MPYHIDLAKISLDDYQKQLAKAYLPHSRLILKEELSKRFGIFTATGMRTVYDLLQGLKKKSTFADLAKADGLTTEYLTILLRELNSILPKPNKLSEFPGIAENVVVRLEKEGIKSTDKLYDKVLTKSDRKKLAKSTGISEKDLLEVTKLSDLSRLKWVGVTFARILFDLGIDTVEKVSKCDPADLHGRINARNKEKGIFKGSIGLNDTKILVQTAKEVPFEMEY